MKKLIVASLALSMCQAWAAKSCDELKTEIEAKLQAHGVKTYTLDIVASDAAAEGKVVGSCEAGKKKILYKKA